jgi:hypothetical protein
MPPPPRRGAGEADAHDRGLRERVGVIGAGPAVAQQDGVFRHEVRVNLEVAERVEGVTQLRGRADDGRVAVVNLTTGNPRERGGCSGGHAAYFDRIAPLSQGLKRNCVGHTLSDAPPRPPVSPDTHKCPPRSNTSTGGP